MARSRNNLKRVQLKYHAEYYDYLHNNIRCWRLISQFLDIAQLHEYIDWAWLTFARKLQKTQFLIYTLLWSWKLRKFGQNYLTIKCKGKTQWSEYASELDRPRDLRLSAKLVPTFSDRGCYVVSATDPYGGILGFLDRSRYFFFQVAPQLYPRGWLDPVPETLLSQKIW
jgi:hypothetical protein